MGICLHYPPISVKEPFKFHFEILWQCEYLCFKLVCSSSQEALFPIVIWTADPSPIDLVSPDKSQLLF